MQSCDCYDRDHIVADRSVPRVQNVTECFQLFSAVLAAEAVQLLPVMQYIFISSHIANKKECINCTLQTTAFSVWTEFAVVVAGQKWLTLALIGWIYPISHPPSALEENVPYITKRMHVNIKMSHLFPRHWVLRYFIKYWLLLLV